MKRLFLLLLFVAAGVLLVSAGKIDGKWFGKIETPNGIYELTFQYKVDGDKLTGSVSSQMGEITIQNGKVTGDEFEYSYDIGSMVIQHKGKLEGEVIKIKSKSERGEREITLTRITE